MLAAGGGSRGRAGGISQQLGQPSTAPPAPDAPVQAEPSHHIVRLIFLHFSSKRICWGFFLALASPCPVNCLWVEPSGSFMAFMVRYKTETLPLRGLRCSTHARGLCSPCPNGGKAESGPFGKKSVLTLRVREAAHGLSRTFSLLLIQRKVCGSCNGDLQTSSSKWTPAANVTLLTEGREK